MMGNDRELTLHWRHNDHDGVSNHQPHGCLFNRLFRRRSKKTSKLRVTGLCVENSPGPVNSPHKGPVKRKMFPFDDVVMRTGRSSLNLPHATRHLVIVSCDNSEFTTASWGYISSPQGNRMVAPPQLASPNPLWPLSLVCIYWSGLSSAPLPPEAGIRLQTARDATVSLVDPTGATTTENGTCADALVTHATWGVCLTSEAHRAPVQISVPFKDFKQKPWWTPRFTLNSSLRLLPARTLFLAFSYMLCMSRTSHSSTPSLPRNLQMTRLGTQSNAFFQIDKGYVQCLIDGIKFFLQLAYNEYGVCGAVSRHEAKLHVIDAHLLS